MTYIDVIISLTPSSATNLVSVNICLIQDLITKIVQTPTKVLSRGTNGMVYLASPNTLVKRSLIFDTGAYDEPKPIFVKVEDQHVLDCNIRELSFLKQFQHPNILRLLDYSICEGKINLAVERGIVLDEWMKEFSCMKRCQMLPKILFQLINALYFFEINGLIHQDVKLGNVIAFPKDGDDFTIKLIDFGGIEFPKNIQYMSLCTSYCRAPEAFKCSCCDRYPCNNGFSPIFSSKGDVFSLGLLCMDWIAKSPIIYDNYDTPGKQRQWLQQGRKSVPDILDIFSRLKQGKVPGLVNIIKNMIILDHTERISIHDLYHYPYFFTMRRDNIPPSIAVDFNHNITEVLSKHTEITHAMRSILIEWMGDIFFNLKCPLALSLAVSMVDRYLRKQVITRDKLQELGCACIILAIAMTDAPRGTINYMVTASDKAFTHVELRDRVEHVILTLDGQLWRRCFDHSIYNPNWTRVLFICMNLNLFSSYSKSSDIYKSKEVVVTDSVITSKHFV